MKRSSWNEIVANQGNNLRERRKHKAIKDYNAMTKDSLSYKDVLINGKASNLIIYAATMDHKKYICSECGDIFYVGDMVRYKDSNWLILRADVDDEIYTRGYMERCNYNLKWQDADGNMLSQECMVLSASQYNSGEFALKDVTIGYNQFMIYITLNDDTKKFRADKRFFIDNNKENPKPYRVTRVDTVSMTFDGVGIVSMIVTEDQYSPELDNIDLEICDYFVKPEITSDIEITYKGKPTITCGGTTKTFAADRDVTFSFDSAIGPENIILTQTETNKCKLKCLNDVSMIGTTINLKCSDGTDSGNILIDIISSI